MNVIYTLNQSGYLTDHVRASHEHAANRWGCEYVVLTEGVGQRQDTFGMKLELHLLPGDRCAWVDGDVLIRSDCPSLFEVVDERLFGAVPVFQDGTWTERSARVMQQSVDRMSTMLDASRRVELTQYVNGGVMVWSQRHHSIWEWLSDAMPSGRTGPMDEQTAQNVALVKFETAIQFMPESMNRLGPATWNLTDRMTDYIHHWARWNEFRGDKQESMNRVEWRV